MCGDSQVSPFLPAPVQGPARLRSHRLLLLQTAAVLTQSATESEEDHSQLWAQTHAWNRQTSALLFSSALQNAAPEATARLPQPQASSISSRGFTTASYGFPGKWQLPTENLGCCHHNAITTQALLIAFLYRFSIKGVVKQNGPNKEPSANHHTFLVFTTLHNNFPELTKLPISAEAQFSTGHCKVHPFYFVSEGKLLSFVTTHTIFDLEWQPEVYCRLFVHILALVQRF